MCESQRNCKCAISVPNNDFWLHSYIKGTPLRSCRVTHIKFTKVYTFLLPMHLEYQNLFCGTLICPLSIWQLVKKLECICWTGKSIINAYLRSTGIIQVLNEMPTNKRQVKVPQDCYALHMATSLTRVEIWSLMTNLMAWQNSGPLCMRASWLSSMVASLTGCTGAEWRATPFSLENKNIMVIVNYWIWIQRNSGSMCFTNSWLSNIVAAETRWTTNEWRASSFSLKNKYNNKLLDIFMNSSLGPWVEGPCVSGGLDLVV